jgi:hypothetical protein
MNVGKFISVVLSVVRIEDGSARGKAGTERLVGTAPLTFEASNARDGAVAWWRLFLYRQRLRSSFWTRADEARRRTASKPRNVTPTR